MKLHHSQPCNECPWRKDAPAGWLGGFDPEFYADAVQMNEAPACHNRDHGPDNDDTAFCAGALATMANQCLLPHRSPGAPEARAEVGRRDDCFGHLALFYEHHCGVAYTHPMARRGFGIA